MLSRLYLLSKHRLLKPQYTDVFKLGRRYRDNAFDILYLKNGLNIPRLGIVIGKKQVRLSVDRHSYKRVIREVFRLQQALVSGYDWVFLLKKDASTLDKKMFRLRVMEVWEKLLAREKQ
jgi:ribonuclease P protein component